MRPQTRSYLQTLLWPSKPCDLTGIRFDLQHSLYQVGCGVNLSNAAGEWQTALKAVKSFTSTAHATGMITVGKICQDTHTCTQTGDFTQLYTSLPYDDLVARTRSDVQEAKLSRLESLLHTGR